MTKCSATGCRRWPSSVHVTPCDASCCSGGLRIWDERSCAAQVSRCRPFCNAVVQGCHSLTALFHFGYTAWKQRAAQRLSSSFIEVLAQQQKSFMPSQEGVCFLAQERLMHPSLQNARWGQALNPPAMRACYAMWCSMMFADGWFVASAPRSPKSFVEALSQIGMDAKVWSLWKMYPQATLRRHVAYLNVKRKAHEACRRKRSKFRHRRAVCPFVHY